MAGGDADQVVRNSRLEFLGNAVEHPVVNRTVPGWDPRPQQIDTRPARSMRQISASQTAEEDPLEGDPWKAHTVAISPPRPRFARLGS
jgi:hypothetical protein